MVLTGLHDVQSARASRHDFELLAHSVCWLRSLLQGVVTVCDDQGKQWFQRACLYLSRGQWRSVLRRSPVGAWEQGKGGAMGQGPGPTAWTTVREAETVCGSHVGRNCWGMLGLLGPCRGTGRGSTTSFWGLLPMDAAHVSAHSSGSPPPSHRSTASASGVPVSVCDGKEIKYTKQDVLLFISLIDQSLKFKSFLREGEPSMMKKGLK